MMLTYLVIGVVGGWLLSSLLYRIEEDIYL